MLLHSTTLCWCTSAAVYSLPAQIELRKIRSNDYSGATVAEWRNRTCQHSSGRSDTGTGCQAVGNKHIVVWKELIGAFRKNGVWKRRQTGGGDATRRRILENNAAGGKGAAWLSVVWIIDVWLSTVKKRSKCFFFRSFDVRNCPCSKYWYACHFVRNHCFLPSAIKT